MPRRSDKHGNMQVLNLNDFSGGLRHTVHSEAIEQNELAGVVNFEFDETVGMLRTIGGYRFLYDTGLDLKNIFYDDMYDGILLQTNDNRIYYTEIGKNVYLGTATGSSLMACTYFGDKVIIATGGKLQTFNGKVLKTVDTSPDADNVFIRSGRVGITKQGIDYVFYSGVGDVENWKFKNDNDSKWTEMDALRIAVGYKDYGNITAVAALSSELLVFKDNGKCFRISGEYPDWAVYEVSSTIDCLNAFSAIPVYNDVLIVGRTGLHNMRTVTEYGAVKSAEAGRKINDFLGKYLSSDCRVWHVESKKQIWIQAQKSDVPMYVYHYGNDAFTTRMFNDRLTGLTVKKGTVYVSIGSKIFIVDVNVATEDNKPVESSLQTKFFVATFDYLIKRVDIESYNVVAGEGVCEVGALKIPLHFGAAGVDIYGDNDDIYGDMGDIWELPVTEVKTRCNYRTRGFDVRFIIKRGALSLKCVRIYYTEV